MMSYMMIFIGVMFFKVLFGLCIYFIILSFWGICEWKLIFKLKLFENLFLLVGVMDKGIVIVIVKVVIDILVVDEKWV